MSFCKALASFSLRKWSQEGAAPSFLHLKVIAFSSMMNL